MNLAIDQGNTLVKVAVFDDASTMIYNATMATLSIEFIAELIENFAIDHIIVCSVKVTLEHIITFLRQQQKHLVVLTDKTPVPIKNLYHSPETLGYDRMAAAVGANFLQPDQNLFIIDMGSAVTYDFVTRNNEFVGGNITPGLSTRLRALHDFTSKLPLLKPDIQQVKLIGQTTEEAIMSGVISGLRFELEGFIREIEETYQDVSVFLTGGESIYFESSLKKPIFAVKNLVFIGLNRILNYNAI
ncbi:MAG: type III pantothenate kinase [Microbacter sp.]